MWPVLRPQATLAFLKQNTELLPHPINEEEFVLSQLKEIRVKTSTKTNSEPRKAKLTEPQVDMGCTSAWFDSIVTFM
jgi:hypothetical protein